MKKSEGKNRLRAEREFDRAMVDSAELFENLVDSVQFPVESDDFLLQELGYLIQDGEPSYEDDDFHFVIKQGIRLYVDPDVDLRARLVGSLRQAYTGMKGASRRVAPTIIGAIEDVDFSLDVVGTVVQGYTKQLLKTLEGMTEDKSVDETAREWIERWTEGTLEEPALLERFRGIGSKGVPAVADLLFDSLEDPTRNNTALNLLSMIHTPVAAQVLAYTISEPILEEKQEELARKILRELWPMALPYVLYNLRRHSHEDIPFRWFELLIDIDNTRAVDRILEEVVAHGRSDNYQEDLLTILPLLDRSNDPGVVGKLLRLITEDSLPKESVGPIDQWIETSPLAVPVEKALKRWKDGKTILIRQREDFNSFAAEQPEQSFTELQRDWNTAYHESLGWQQRSQCPRGPIETQFEQKLEEAMIKHLSLNPRLEESALRDQVEFFRESWLVTPQSDVIPLVAICMERERNTPWLEEIYWREINAWYIKAAQYFDEGERDKARHYLAIILQVEPEYPLALMLVGIIESSAMASGGAGG